jgi:hypothetical protein
VKASPDPWGRWVAYAFKGSGAGARMGGEEDRFLAVLGAVLGGRGS